MVFPKYRALVIQKYRDDIIRKFNNNTRPTDIAGELRDLVHDDPRLAGITAQDVSNALARHRQEELAGRTPLQFLYDRLDKSDFFHRDSRDPQGRLTGLFLAPRATFHRWRQHHDVLVLDCTYKTNRFNMPLLNICAATRDNKTFSIASIFLNGETESHYYWAISLLLVLCEKESIPFPRVTVTDRDTALLKALDSFRELQNSTNLCTWHINQNVVAKCKQFFPKASKSAIESYGHGIPSVSTRVERDRQVTRCE
ncbi:MULE transposase [Hirsutella rhossiliensis]|uniref:MULE transposase domain-containing protein n=1 Tax=Hirsutella rhossiliensis TaxID=111463 RepID=A0A9P8N8C6_9HYPO|nr:MULE transposase domain-containing protein [Hirsutella rhossiliensis]KAH0967574.1 MULE transposase domain-containing protein [Hirsutella rhossiliensis]